MRYFLTFASVFVLCFNLQAQDTAYARHVIADLSSPAMYGRGAEHRGDSIAAEYLRSEMRRLGVKPLVPDYYQYYTYPVYIFEQPISLSINGHSLDPYSQFRIVRPSIGHSQSSKSDFVRCVDGIQVVAVEKLDTYGPLSYSSADEPFSVEVLSSMLPHKVRKMSLSIPFSHQTEYWSQNVCGIVHGEVDSIVIFAAHYDHCGSMGSQTIFPGAHDNASGVAAVLDLARLAAAHQPHYTQVFLLFSGEEAGIRGSHFASDHPLVDYSKVKLFCNIDMFCGGDDGLMVFNADSPETQPYFNRLESFNEQHHLAKEIRPRKNSPNSDHYYFSRYVPAIFLLTMGQPYGGYHDPADTCQACGLSHYADYLTLILQLIAQ